MSGRLGELLVSKGIVSAKQLEEALQEQKLSGVKLGSALVKLGYITEKNLVSFLSRHYGVQAIDLSEVQIDPEVIKMIPPEVVFKYQVIPFKRVGSTLRVAMSDPSNILAIDDIKFLTSCHVEVFVSTESAIKAAIEKFYDSTESLADIMGTMDEIEKMELLEESEEVDIHELQQASEDAPVVKLVNLILNEAIKRRASDIHLEPYEKVFRVRFRVDGVLHEFMKPPMKLKNAIISRVKIMAKLDIAEKRLPQDGRIPIRIADKEIDIRISIIPTSFGERVVLRLLDKSHLLLGLEEIGLAPDQLQTMENLIHRPQGMILVTGPTGSGKTTTLYAALNRINSPDKNIITIEDPVEYQLPGIGQMQVNPKIGLTFAQGLRSVLRHDPDVILVGEIRDPETAEIAIQAALTGHLVFSTLHTNDAASAVTRLIDMGVEPFLVASVIRAIVAQRLVRMICPACRKKYIPDSAVLSEMGLEATPSFAMYLYHGQGCPDCAHTGFRGRTGIYEILIVSDPIRQLIMRKADSGTIAKQAGGEGMHTLRADGLRKVMAGITTFDEVIRVTQE